VESATCNCVLISDDESIAMQIDLDLFIFQLLLSLDLFKAKFRSFFRRQDKISVPLIFLETYGPGTGCICHQLASFAIITSNPRATFHSHIWQFGKRLLVMFQTHYRQNGHSAGRIVFEKIVSINGLASDLTGTVV